MYKLYEYHDGDMKIAVIMSDTEKLLYIGSRLYSAKTNATPNKTVLNSDITGRGLVKVILEPYSVSIAGTDVQPVHTHEAEDKASILQYWQSRL